MVGLPVHPSAYICPCMNVNTGMCGKIHTATVILSRLLILTGWLHETPVTRSIIMALRTDVQVYVPCRLTLKTPIDSCDWN